MRPSSERRVAVVLFNLGGPDKAESVRPFLFNLFHDPNILAVPQPFRRLLAWVIAGRRAPIAGEIYQQLGGGSPLLANTEEQAERLREALGRGDQTRVYIAMRYWHPRAKKTAREVERFQPDIIILLPLYPQFSQTTTGSSLDEWRRVTGTKSARSKTVAICCYPLAAGFVAAMAMRVKAGLTEIPADATKPRVLFSAHGLPKRNIERGDPYQWQVEQTAAAIVEKLAIPGLDWLVTYQSRVGPLEWIGPSTDAEITRAGAEKTPLVVVPIAFVSEHSETLVELDIEYRHLADAAGVPHYIRVPAVAAQRTFIDALADLVRLAISADDPIVSGSGGRFCPAGFVKCRQPVRQIDAH